jgi:hypothetical protein
MWNGVKQQCLAKHWKTARREVRTGKKSKMEECGKTEETEDTLTINPHKKNAILEDDLFTVFQISHYVAKQTQQI